MQTDRQTGGGWSQGGGQTAPGEGGEVTGDRTCSRLSYLFLFFLNALRRSLVSPVGPQTCSTKKDKPLVLSSASPPAEKLDAVFFFFFFFFF